MKALLRRHAPSLYFGLKGFRRHAQFRRGHGGAEYRATEALVARHGRRVVGGPFLGMRYVQGAMCSAYVAKPIGSYEEELHPSFEAMVRSVPERVIDVGCAEGYYAVGLALRLPSARVFAFDTDEEAQWYCRNLAKLNGVASRVTVTGFCDHAALEELAGPRSAVLCDCEGFEHELLDPVRVPRLRETDLLVELHEFVRAGLTQDVLERFEDSHHTTLIDTRERNPAAYPLLECVAEADRPWAVREGRPGPMQWAYLNAGRRT